uniref:Uncharacterized protein n=1 Tax=Rhizophora mucronata TaxID=61149 RepID=A0A2P2NGG8_RHIMU
MDKYVVFHVHDYTDKRLSSKTQKFLLTQWIRVLLFGMCSCFD